MAATVANKAAAQLELRRRNRLRYRADPEAFAREQLGIELTADQLATIESLRDNPWTAVVAANGTGKTHVGATAVLWFMECHEDPLCYTTAPNFRQVVNNLWKEIRRYHAKALPPLQGVLLPKHPRWDLSADSFAEGMATTSEESLKGGHAKNFLIVVDEAQGVDATIFDGIKTMAKGRHARLLLIGNASQVSGEFFDAFHTKTELYSTARIPASSHPNVTAALAHFGIDWTTWVEAPAGVLVLPDDWQDPVPGALSLFDLDRAKVDFGVGTATWKVVVEGVFPDASDRTLISLAWLEQARNGGLTPLGPLPDRLHALTGKWAGLDVARFGADRSCLVRMDGPTVESIEVWQGYELSHTAGKALAAIRAGYTLCFDEGGLGAGITSHLKEQGVKIGTQAHPVNAGSSPHEAAKVHYPKMRDQLWGDAADLLRAGTINTADLPLDDHRKLTGELTAPEYTLDSASRKKVESKDQLKKRIGRSPDIADAFNLACHRPAKKKSSGAFGW